MPIKTVEQERAALRQKQRERVMRIIPALMEEWDQCPNDAKSSLEADAPHFVGLLNEINEAMES